jgi:hypothetical protein
MCMQYVTLYVKKHNTRNVLVHSYELQDCVHSCSVLSFITAWNFGWKLTYVCLALLLA